MSPSQTQLESTRQGELGPTLKLVHLNMTILVLFTHPFQTYSICGCLFHGTYNLFFNSHHFHTSAPWTVKLQKGTEEALRT